MKKDNVSQPGQQPLVYTVKETAEALCTCTKTVRRLIKRGFFSPCKALRKILIPRAQVEDFLRRTCGTPTAKF
jgi:excisionase family DNA binding protein